MKDKITAVVGNCSRVLKDVRAAKLEKNILGDKCIKYTVINIKDSNMTFRSAKGDVTLQFLK